MGMTIAKRGLWNLDLLVEQVSSDKKLRMSVPSVLQDIVRVLHHEP